MDVLHFSSELGFTPVVFGDFAARPWFYWKFVRSWRVAQSFLALYPMSFRDCFSTSNPLRRFDKLLLDIVRRRKTESRTDLFVDDLPIEQAYAQDEGGRVDDESYELEAKVFELFDILCVYNKHSRRWIRERYGVADENFVEIEFRDNWIPEAITPPQGAPQVGLWKLVYVGSGAKAYAGTWPLELKLSTDVSYEFIGDDWDWLGDSHRNDQVLKPTMDQKNLSNYLPSHFHFGIVAYSEKINAYSKYICPSKFASYLASGLPVLVASDCESVAELVDRYGIGFSLHSLRDIPDKLRGLSESDYARMRVHCSSFAERIRTGYYFKRALTEAMRKFA